MARITLEEMGKIKRTGILVRIDTGPDEWNPYHVPSINAICETLRQKTEDYDALLRVMREVREILKVPPLCESERKVGRDLPTPTAPSDIVEALRRAAAKCERYSWEGDILRSAKQREQAKADAALLRDLADKYEKAWKRAGPDGNVTLAVRVGPVKQTPPMELDFDY